MRPVAPLLLPLLALACLAAVAGCSAPAASPGPADSGSPSPEPAAPSAPVAVGDPVLPPGADGRAFTDCRQYHTAFPAQASDLQPLMPEGFTVRTDEAGLATLMALATDCAEAAWLFIEVGAVPPPQWDDADGTHAVAIEAYVGEQALLSWLHGHGFALAEACACAATTGPAGGQLLDGFTSDGADDDYDMQTALTPSSGEFPALKGYVYVAQDGKAVARLVEAGSASMNRGLGSVVLQYTGPGAAPPVFPGEVAHEIEGLALAWTVERLA